MLNYSASPNVLIIACNGLSYGDISCHGNPRIQTPNLDKLFHHGIRLDQFHIELHPKLVHKHLIFSRNDQDSSISKDINLPLIFGYNDYITGFFGEWHLADQLTQGNKYFNEFFTTNHPVELSQELKRAKFSYSHTTNHSFFLAEEFIKRCSNNKKQFMILISTNNFEHNQFLELSESATLPFFDKELSGHFHSINNIDTLIGSLNKTLELEKCKFILIRQNPPFNLEYISTTYILDSIKNKVKIINDPTSIRSISEKLYSSKYGFLLLDEKVV